MDEFNDLAISTEKGVEEVKPKGKKGKGKRVEE